MNNYRLEFEWLWWIWLYDFVIIVYSNQYIIPLLQDNFIGKLSSQAVGELLSVLLM